MIGPYFGDNSVEILELPSLELSSCKIPKFPVFGTEGYVMGNVESGVLACGGKEQGLLLYTACFLFSNGRWLSSLLDETPSMNDKRHSAVSAHLGDAFWVTGGKDDFDIPLISTEIRNPDGSWSRFVDLPKKMSDYCMVTVNSTHVFLAGGINGATIYKTTYLYSMQSGWKVMEDMIDGRFAHTCSLLGDDEDTIVLVGGSKDNVALSSTVLFSISTGKWTAGPAFPTSLRKPQMVSVNGQTYLVSGLDIYHLDQQNGDTLKWMKAGKIENKIPGFRITPIKNPDGC